MGKTLGVGSCFLPSVQLTNSPEQKTPISFPRNGVLSSIIPRLSPLSAVDEMLCFIESCYLLKLIERIDSMSKMSRNFGMKCSGVFSLY